MSKPTDSNEKQVSEGTAHLQQIADDLVAERERTGDGTNLPNDETASGDEAETREDHLEPEVNTPLDDRLDEQK